MRSIEKGLSTNLPCHESWNVGVDASNGKKYAKVPNIRLVVEPHDWQAYDADKRVEDDNCRSLL